MSGAIFPLTQYAFMAWCSVKKSFVYRRLRYVRFEKVAFVMFYFPHFYAGTKTIREIRLELN